MTKLAEILATPDNWTKGSLAGWRENRAQPAYCLAGALLAQVGVPAWKIGTGCTYRDLPPAITLLVEVICDLYPNTTNTARYPLPALKVKDLDPEWSARIVTLFNDCADTTFEDVHRVAAEFDRRYALLAEGL